MLEPGYVLFTWPDVRRHVRKDCQAFSGDAHETFTGNVPLISLESSNGLPSLSLYIYIYIYIYVHTHVHEYMNLYIVHNIQWHRRSQWYVETAGTSRSWTTFGCGQIIIITIIHIIIIIIIILLLLLIIMIVCIMIVVIIIIIVIVILIVILIIWLRTSGVNTNGAAAKVMTFDRFGEKGTPWHFWEGSSRLTGVPTKLPLSTSMTFGVTPLVLTPFVPFRDLQRRLADDDAARAAGVVPLEAVALISIINK